MVLNRKGFFLELGEQEPQAAESKPEPKLVNDESASEASQPATVPVPVPVEETASAASSAQASAPVPVAAKSKIESTAESTGNAPKVQPSLPTAEAIAAELAAAEAAKPEIQLSTFAPEALQPGNSIRPGKRRPGNNLAEFRSMASELFKS
tara:strand:+ start:146 stop:598 length:453 start_codon:yes stop_codon:yes gene_type:complete